MTTFWYKGKEYVACRVHKDCDCIFDRPSIAQIEKWRAEDGDEDEPGRLENYHGAYSFMIHRTHHIASHEIASGVYVKTLINDNNEDDVKWFCENVECGFLNKWGEVFECEKCSWFPVKKLDTAPA